MKKFIDDTGKALGIAAAAGLALFGLVVMAIALTDIIPLEPGVIIGLICIACIAFAAIRLLIRELRGDDD